MQELTKEQIDSILKNLNEKMVEPDRVLALIESGERVCVGCGCSDNCACDGGCEWLDIDPSSGFGVCSECSEFLDMFGNKSDNDTLLLDELDNANKYGKNSDELYMESEGSCVSNGMRQIIETEE